MGVLASDGTYSVLSSLLALYKPLDGACAPLDLEVFSLDLLEVAVDPLELLQALCDVPVGVLSNAGEEVKTILPLRGSCFDG